MTSYILEHLAVIFSAATGAWAARGKSVDLFGVIVLGLVTAMGGGTIRDLLLDAPVFWVVDSNFIISSALAACASFFIARYLHPSQRLFQIPDAFGLAFVTMLGAAKTHELGHSGPVCVVLGVTTGIAGGMLRDVISGEIPLVFRPHINLYATAAVIGAVTYVLAEAAWPGFPGNMLIGATVILGLRLAAIRWRIRLPVFQTFEL